MSTFRLQGGHPLTGTLAIAGRKNAALPLIAGSILTTGTTTLTNVPDIEDVRVLLEIMTTLGAEVKRDAKTVTINTANLTVEEIPADLGHKLRGSLLLMGPLLTRFGHVRLPHPGGCIIGKRPVGVHFDVAEALGATVTTEDGWYTVTAEKLTGTTFFLPEASVTGSENALFMAAGCTEPVTLVNVALEDHVLEVGEQLKALGCQIDGLGSHTVTVQGFGRNIPAVDFTREMLPDEIELGTFMVAAAVTGGTLTLTNLGDAALTLPIRDPLRRLGVNFEYDEAKQSLTVKPPHNLKAGKIKTGIWPGIPSDLQPLLALLATQTPGNTLIHDWMYEGRFTYIAGLSKMGADILICDPHRILITGPTKLKGTKLISPDLRAGAAQLLAGLAAEGESIIEHGEIIERGYEAVVERLQSVGAQIERLA